MTFTLADITIRRMTFTPADITLLESAAADLDGEALRIREALMENGEWRILSAFDQRMKDENDRFVAHAAGLRELAQRMKAAT